MMMIFLVILSILLIILGLIGTVYSVLPSMPLMLAGVWLLAYAGDFGVLASGSLMILTAVAVVGFVLDSVAGILGAKYTGASKWAIWGALLGGLVGLFLGLVGVLFAPLLGAAVGEFWARRDLLSAGKVGLGAFVGLIVGTVAKMGAALVMVAVVLWQYGLYWYQS